MTDVKERSIMVSIVCNTYNQEDYIAQALDSFIMQKTDFEFEILVHDDASTDKTAEIIRRYEAKYPELVKPIYQTENQYSQGVHVGENFQYPRVQGKYIALCEGDDYWTDPCKLQKQFNAMEAHQEIDMCAHCADQVNAETGEVICKIQPAIEDCILTQEQVIQGTGGFVATNSLFFRKSMRETLPRFYLVRKFDLTLQIHGALRGGMLYLKDNMSAYRYLAKNSWTRSVRSDASKLIEMYESAIKMFSILDDETDGKYHEVIQKCIQKTEMQILIKKNDCKKVLDRKYRDVYKTLPWKKRMKIRIGAMFPWLVALRQKRWSKKY